MVGKANQKLLSMVGKANQKLEAGVLGPGVLVVSGGSIPPAPNVFIATAVASSDRLGECC